MGLQDNIVQYFSDYLGVMGPCHEAKRRQIAPLEDHKKGRRASSTKNHRFFPTVGNHDWQGFTTPDPASQRPDPAYFQFFNYLRSFAPNATTLGPMPASAGFYSHEVVPGLLSLFSLNSNLGNPQEKDAHLPLAQEQ